MSLWTSRQHPTNRPAMGQATAFLTPDQRPPILFRLLYTLQRGRSTQTFDNDGDLLAENPQLPLVLATADSHLSWAPTPTPYTSYLNSWRKIMQKRQWLLDRGATNITIIAIDTSRLNRILSAEAMAVALGYQDAGFDPRRKVRNHRHEYLVYGGILGDDYAILSVIPGDGIEQSVRVGNRTSGLPSGFLTGLTTSVEEELENDIYRHTGVRHTLKWERLIEAMCS